jgi:membrane-associated phospholipid phosphatase
LLFAYFLIVSCVALGQYLAPSAGPIFFERIGLGDRFAALPVSPWAQTAADYLWQDYLGETGKLGTGISAMPSLHIAISGWFVLVFRSQLPRLQFIALAYFGLIAFGSVYLGWHYAVDGIVGVLIVGIAWYGTQFLTLSADQRKTQSLLDAGSGMRGRASADDTRAV